MTNAALAEATGLTPTPTLQRLRKLEQLGVIQRFTAVVDPKLAGRPVLAFVHVTLKSHHMPVHTRVLEIVTKLDAVLECHHIAGDEDFLLKVAMREIGDLEKLLFEIGASGDVARLRTTFVLSSSKTAGPLPIDEEEP